MLGGGGVARPFYYITYDKPKKKLFFLLDCVKFIKFLQARAT